MPIPPILVVVPPLIKEPRGPIAPKFLGAAPKCAGLADEYRAVANALNCAFFDANTVTTASKVDGVHLDADQHCTLGLALVEAVDALLVN